MAIASRFGRAAVLCTRFTQNTARTRLGEQALRRALPFLARIKSGGLPIVDEMRRLVRLIEL